MQDLNDLYYFVQAVEHGGFAPAGRALGQPKSLLSRRIARLEDRLGLRLIQRTTRHFDLTPAGGIYFEHCNRYISRRASRNLWPTPSAVQSFHLLPPTQVPNHA